MSSQRWVEHYGRVRGQAAKGSLGEKNAPGQHFQAGRLEEDVLGAEPVVGHQPSGVLGETRVATKNKKPEKLPAGAS